MTYSAPPPEPPPIVQILPTKAQRPASTGTSVLLAQSLTATRTTENAAALGTPITVGYPHHQGKTLNSASSHRSSSAKLSKRSQARKALGTSQQPAAKTPSAQATTSHYRLAEVLRAREKSTPAASARQQLAAKNPVADAQTTPSHYYLAEVLRARQKVRKTATTNQLPTVSTTASDLETTTSSLTQLSPQAQPTDPRTTSVIFRQRQASQKLAQAEVESPSSQPLEFHFQAPTVEQQPVTPLPTEVPREQTVPQPPSQPPATPVKPIPQPPNQPAGQGQPPATAPPQRRIVEVTADRQEYDDQRQIVTAEGNVLVRIDGTVLDADRLQVNIQNLIAVGEGNVALTRGQQVLRGERFTYNIVQDSGEIRGGSGEIFIPSAGSDFSTLPTDVTASGVVPQPQSDRITANQPLQNVSSPGGIGFSFGSDRGIPNFALPEQGGQIRRLRFEAEQIDFNPGGWQARNVRITNDPFSPPELELRANTVTLTRETPLRDRIRTTKQRLVFDQGFSVPIPRDEAVIDRQRRDPGAGPFQIGYDGEDRGGLFIERGFNVLNTGTLQLNLTPQFLVQRAVTDNDGNPFGLSQYGLRARLQGNFGLRTALRGTATFTSLDPDDFDDQLRANFRLQQIVGTRLPHLVTLESGYRDRIYNGTLGYRTVQNSIGAILNSPVIPLGNTGINLSYQGGIQYINADTDRLDLLEPIRDNNRAELGRFQGSAALSRYFTLWQGKGLPATATAGLRYTPVPVVPFLSAVLGLTGSTSFYTNGDNQSTLIGTVGLQGQFGNFSRPWFDYTSFNLSYSDGFTDGRSPFLFDRQVDTRTLSAGLTQQIYGPFRLGAQIALNLDNSEVFSADLFLDYSRRTFGVTLRYNPELELGSISLRISDFNWVGGADPFSGVEVRPAVGGVIRD